MKTQFQAKFQVEFKKIPRKSAISVGSGVTQDVALLSRIRKNVQAQAFVLADQRLIGHRRVFLRSLKKAGWKVTELPLHAGESLKEMESIYPIYGKLLQAGADRDSVLFALGGGSIGDAVGFIASTFLRGVSWVSVPTTLLAQVDSGLGGKTGINHQEGKNLIGTFHQPDWVICDTDFLETLSARERLSGWGEILKYGLVYNRAQLVRNFSEWSKDPRELAPMISKCLKWKARAVAQDEQDRKGVRQALNFGHTFGHALEKYTDYREYQHGEAVLWGMRFAVALSEVRGHLSSFRGQELREFLSKIQVPELPREFSAEDLAELIKKDKKKKQGRVQFVLLKGTSQIIHDAEVSFRDLVRAFKIIKADA